MKQTHNKILITGGASGIGLGLTEKFLANNNTVIVCGRRISVLQDLQEKHPTVITKQCDIEQESERIALFHWIKEEHPDLQVLVNNAGIQQWMHVQDHDLYERAHQEITINALAPIHLSNLFLQLPSLTTIINVTSGLAFVPLTKVPVYCATKAFLHSFTLSLRHLLKEKNIEVIELIPPALNTDLGGVGLHDAYPPVSDFIESVFRQLEEGKQEITFGLSANMATATPEGLSMVFQRMNP